MERASGHLTLPPAFKLFPVLAGAAAVLVIAAVVLAQSEWGERRIERFLAAHLHRDVAIENLHVAFAWPPRIELAALRIANPDWAKSDSLVDANGLAFNLEVLPIFSGRLVVDRLTVERADVGLEQEHGQATWRFGKSETQSKGRAPFELQQLEVRSADILYRHAEEGTSLRVHAQGTTGRGGGVAMQAEGTYRGEKATARASAPTLLLSADQAIEMELEATIGATHGKARGTLRASSSAPPAIDAAIHVASPGLHHLDKLLPIDLPRSPPIELDGNFVYHSGRWRLDDFRGRIGDSDVEGRFSYESRQPRPIVTADVHSHVLDLDDLGPLLGAPPSTKAGEAASAAQKRQAKKREREGALLPSLPLHSTGWDAVDATVSYEAERIKSAPPSALQSLTVKANLDDGRLRLAPVQIGVAGGRIDGEVMLNSRKEPLHASLSADVRAVELAKLFPKVRSQSAALGSLYGKAKLEGTGGSVADLLGSSDGSITAAVEGGSVNGLLVEAAGLDIAEALLVLGSKRREKVPLNCAVADFTVRDGEATVNTFVVDTRDTRVSITGSIDLDAERLDLVARPQPRDASALAARSPIVVEGTLREPSVHPDGGALAERAGAAVLLGIINPLLALVPLIQPGKDVPNDCAKLLDEARAGAAND